MKFIILIMLTILILSPELSADDLTGPEIIGKVTELLNQKSSRALMTLAITTSSGKERKFTYESFSFDQNEKNTIVYSSPKRVKGQAMLLLNNADDIWSYDPRTDRVRKLATHAKRQKMQGSDFTYEDMGGGDSFLTDFDAKRLTDDKMQDYDCYRVVLTNNETGSSNYLKLVMYVIKENFLPVVIDYYEKESPKVAAKRLVQSDIRTIDGVPTGMKMVMRDNLDDSYTVVQILEVKYNIDIDKSRFESRSFFK